FRGDWAVVTGASGDIGRAFVHALARRGLNVALVARSAPRLADVARDVEQHFAVRTAVHAFDFAAASRAEWDALRAALAAHRACVLVNNVGISLEMPTDLVDVPDELVERLVDVNIRSTNRVTKMLLPAMVAARKGVVLCLASGGGAVTPAPMLSPYAGTKAYIDAFAVSVA
ncbi:Xanthoxin dehydrogenase, partial [Gracilaria domingensis]